MNPRGVSFFDQQAQVVEIEQGVVGSTGTGRGLET
jgi:hypothetical protein